MKVRGIWISLVVFAVAAGIIGCGGAGGGSVLTGGTGHVTNSGNFSTSSGGGTSTGTTTATTSTGGTTTSGSTTTGSTGGTTTTTGSTGSTTTGSTTTGSTTTGSTTTGGTTTAGTTGGTTGGTLTAPFDMVFVSDRNLSRDIYAMENDGGNVTTIIVNSLFQDYDPCLSPDGTKIAYVAEISGEAQIWLWDTSSNSTVKLTTSANAKATPCFSPDGTKIVFADSVANEIYIVNIDGSGLTNLTNTVDEEDRDPIFTKDGSRILFASNRGVQLTPSFGVFSMRTDGTDLKELFDDPTNEVQPWLSTDGTKLVYRNNNNIWIANSDGTNRKELTTTGNCTRPTFTRDGTRIIYTVNNNGESLFSMNLDGTDNRKISGLGNNSSARCRP